MEEQDENPDLTLLPVSHSTPLCTFYECGRKSSKTKLMSIVTDSN